MIYGTFGEIGELMFEIDLIAVDGERLTVDVLLDTGFTTGYLAIDIQDAENLGWSVIERSVTMRTARGLDYFDIYEGKVFLDNQEYIIPVLAGAEITEVLLGLQWLKILPLTVNFASELLILVPRTANNYDYSEHQRLADISPTKRFSQGFIKEVNKC